MSKELKISISPDGDVTRDEDKKHLAAVNLETGEIKYSNAAYAKGNYKKAIEKIAKDAAEGGVAEAPSPELPQEANEPVDAGSDPRIPPAVPPRCHELGEFTPAHINYDHANLSDKEFAAKYGSSAASQLEFVAVRPELFADREALEERLATLATA